MSFLRRLASILGKGAEVEASVLAAAENGVVRRLIVGLGNPGRKYSGTRHNVGFEVCDILAKRADSKFKPEFKWKAEVAKTPHGILVKPLTFMNESGQAVRALADFYKLGPGDCFVVHDDVSFPLGSLRIRRSGSAGGHNGIKSIIGCLGSQDFPRLKFGIGTAEGNQMTSHVLGKFDKSEKELLPGYVEDAADAVECVFNDGLEQAMAKWNGKRAD